MKVLHLLYAGLGGHANVFFSFIKADAEKELQYEALFLGVESIRPEYEQLCSLNKISWQHLKKRKGIDVNFSTNLFNAIRQSQSAIIFLHGSRFVLIAAMAALAGKNKKRLIVRETQANHLKSFYDWLWLAAAMVFAKNVVFLTNESCIAAKNKLWPVWRSKKIRVINNGIDLEFFKAAHKPLGNTVVLGMQSRIVPIKDHTTLLKAFSILINNEPSLDLQLNIAGDGDFLKPMQQLASELGLGSSVLFTGTLAQNELLTFLQSLDIYVHASLGETMSTAIMQAMACGLPIVASNVPGINNMIRHDATGLLVASQNETALAESIRMLINNSLKAELLGKAAYNYAHQHFSNTLMFAKYMELLQPRFQKKNE